MRFSIRDLLLVTVIVGLTVGWWMDRSRLAARAKDAESFQALSETLAQQLQDQHPAASIEISVNGRGVITSKGYAAPSAVEVDVKKMPKSRARAPKPPNE